MYSYSSWYVVVTGSKVLEQSGVLYLKRKVLGENNYTRDVGRSNAGSQGQYTVKIQQFLIVQLSFVNKQFNLVDLFNGKDYFPT